MSSEKEKLVEREKNLEHDQNDDISFDTRRVLAADQLQYRVNGIRDEVQLTLYGGVPFPYFKLPFQPDKQAFEPRVIP